MMLRGKWRGGAYLDGEIVFDFVEASGGGEAADGVHGESLLAPGYYAFAVARVLSRKNQAQVREVACCGQPHVDRLGLFGQRFDFALRLISFVVVDDLLIDTDRDLLYRHPFRLVHPVRIRGQLDVDADGIQRAV